MFNNWPDSDTSFKATSTQLTGRATYVPYLSADESNLVHVGVGLRYSTADLPLKGKADAEFFQAPAFIKTDGIPANNLWTYVLEGYWRKGPYMLGSEYIGNRAQSKTVDNPYSNGWSITGSWIVTGEMRKYRMRSGLFDPVPISRQVGQGGWGALEAVARYSNIDLRDANNNGGIMRTFSLGANWWLTETAQFSCNYRTIGLNSLGIKGHSSGINFRLLLMLD